MIGLFQLCPVGGNISDTKTGLYIRRITMFRWSSAFCLIILFVLMNSTLFAEGVTIITHGANDNIENWIDDMQEAIWFRFPAGWNITVYPLYVQDNGLFDDTVTLGTRTGTAPLESNSGEIILLLDWSQSNSWKTDFSNTDVVDAIIPVLLSSSFIPELGKPLAQLPFHLIGHSRGGSLVCGLARALGENGISVDHITTLDSHPIYGDEEPLAYSNVLFVDNYFQQVEFPQGQSIAGAYNREYGVLWGGYGGYYELLPGANHSNTHLWYHGTIDLNTPITVDNATIDSIMRDQWWRSSENEGAKAGYYYSRIIGGDRLNYPVIAGYSEYYGGYAERVPVDLSNASWPSIYTFDIEQDGRTIKYDESIGTGEFLNFIVAFQDPDSECTVCYYFDTDRNPYNNNNLFTIGSKSPFLQTTTSDRYIWNTSTVPAGTIGYVCAEINDGIHKRFFYSPAKLTFYNPVTTAYKYLGTFFCKGVNPDYSLNSPADTLIYPDDYPDMYVVAHLKDAWNWCIIDEHQTESISIHMWVYDPDGNLFASGWWLFDPTPTVPVQLQFYANMLYGFYLPNEGVINNRFGRWTYRTVISVCNGSGIDDTGSFYIIDNSAPDKASTPNPPNTCFANKNDTVLSWSQSARADSYLVYFGTDPTPDTGEFVAEQSELAFDPGQLQHNTTYYWRVDTNNPYGCTTGDVWSFKAVSIINPDINDEGIINLLDFSSLANQWMHLDCTKLNNWCNLADIDYSGTVDANDLLLVAYNWLTQKPRFYVDSTAQGNNNGSCWKDAFTSIETALQNAVYGDHIWVAKGTYAGRITLPDGVALYGGFAGYESLLSARNWAANETIISGGIDVTEGATISTCIDGFTITNGTGNNGKGGGIYMMNASPVIANNKITANSIWGYDSEAFGGGIYVNGGEPMIVGNLIVQNHIYVQDNYCGYLGVYGGGICLAGGYAIIVNNTIAENSVENWSFCGGDAAGGGLYIGSGDHFVSNSVIWGNSNGISGTCEVSFCNVQGGYAGNSNINRDPLFVNDYQIRADSPCINTASNDFLPANLNRDLAWQPRVAHGIVDMGAYEYQEQLQVILPEFNPSGGTYNTEQTVTITCAIQGAIIHYTLDGSEPTEDDPVIASGGSLYIDRSATLKAKAWKDGFVPSHEKAANFTVVVARPSFSPGGGTYNVEQNVIITCATLDAAIHYTTNGVEPTQNDPVITSGDSIYIDRSLTLKANAWKSNFDPSSRTANYQLIVAAPVFSPDGAVYQSDQTVVVTCETPGAIIHYTTDGIDPTESDPVIDSGNSLPIGVIPSTTLKAKAFKANFISSAVKTAEYRGPNVFYVSPTGNNANDGLSWSTAKQSISHTLSISGNNDLIWIAAGTYSGRITVPNGVALYGGFTGTETQLSQRNWAINETIISGGVNISAGATSATRIDGFTITNGYAEKGGGIYMVNASPILTNNKIIGNMADYGSGWGSDDGGCGGGIYISGGAPLIAGNLLADNHAYGWEYFEPFVGINQYLGGKGGGIYISDGFATLINNTMSNNVANSRYGNPGIGGGIYVNFGTQIVQNSIIWDNAADLFPQVAGMCDISYSNVEGGYAGDGNINTDPAFIDPVAGDYQIDWYYSPCIEVGDNTCIPEWMYFDLVGNPRLFDWDGDDLSIIDIGAFEVQW
jgi:hypothetical protein